MVNRQPDHGGENDVSTPSDLSNGMSRILLSPPDVGEDEREALIDAFDSGWIAPAGPELAAFEADLVDFTGAEACVALSSGSAALHLALLVAGVRPGDEVVVPTATFAASAFAVLHAGAVPVFCDVSPDTWCLDLALLEGYLEQSANNGQLPAAVMPVDLYGYMPDYAQLGVLCQSYGVGIVEDAAEALGSTQNGAMAGAMGHLGALSFNGNKIMTTSGGGALLGPVELVDQARYLSTQARDNVLHYEHREIGYNFRMSNLLAALGRAQLRGLAPRIERRREIHRTYVQKLPDVAWRTPLACEEPNAWLSVGQLPEDVDALAACRELGKEGIEARPFWKPMHQQPVFSGSSCIGGGAVAERCFLRGIALPSGSSLSSDDQERVVAALLSVLDSVPSGA